MAAIAFAPARRSAVTADDASRLAIGGPLFDALLLWGAPALAFLICAAWMALVAVLPHAPAAVVVSVFAACMSILTYSHLIAIAPRVYLNRDVFWSFPFRLTVVPLLMVAAFALSPAALVCGAVLTVFWDVYHSAAQTFGLGRIYDMKAGNNPLALRRLDLLLNCALYIGPILAGAAMIEHMKYFHRFAELDWSYLASVPSLAAGWVVALKVAGIALWLGVVAYAVLAYRRMAAEGYALSFYKRRLLVVTATVSIVAWGFMPPVVAFATVNLFHAVQYYAIVWLKEGKRITGLAGNRPMLARWSLPLFVGACLAFGTVYWAVASGAATTVWLAPFIACSLFHFWADGFVWSVRARQV